MIRYWCYLKYVLAHKWFVFLAAHKVDCPLWLAVVHDLSKFGPQEFTQYARTFYDDKGENRFKRSVEFDYAWNNHQKYNKHHWQHWLSPDGEGNSTPLYMPLKYTREMVADWMGAGQAINGEIEVHKWYADNKDRMLLHADTRKDVEQILYRLSIILLKR